MIKHALARFDRVIFVIGEANLRSRRAIEKIGGVLTDQIHDAIMAGTLVRHVVYSVDQRADDWIRLYSSKLALMDRKITTLLFGAHQRPD